MIHIALTLFITCYFQNSRADCSSPCSMDTRWSTFRCSNVNPFMDEKTIFISALSSVQWPQDLFCLALRRNLRVSGTYQISTDLMSVAPISGRGDMGLAFNIKDENNFDFAVLRLIFTHI